MEINEEILNNIKQLGYNLEDEVDERVGSMAPEIGYELIGKGITYEDGTKGVLVKMPEGKNKYNNGIYILHELINNAVVLEVVVPNTKDKGALIQQLVGDITTFVDGLHLEDLDTFDFVEMYGFVIADTVIKPLAKALFPDDKAKQERFTLLYLPRFMANIAYQYVGSENTFEEGVNSEPYVVKMMIDNATMEKTNSNASETQASENEDEHNEDV